MTVIPTSVTVASANARTCSFVLVRARSNIHLDNTKFDRLSTEVMLERTNMLVLDSNDEFISVGKVGPLQSP